MANVDYDFFLQKFSKVSTFMDETCFYFTDDVTEDEHIIGCLPEFEKPYWAGYCDLDDLEDGASYKTADELLSAKIFDGKSLKERWKAVYIYVIGGMDIDTWIKTYAAKEAATWTNN